MNDIEISPQENEERLGDYLRSAREKLELSLADISNETKIRKYYLECFLYFHLLEKVQDRMGSVY